MHLVFNREVPDGHRVVKLLPLRRWQVQCRNGAIHGLHRCLCGRPLLGFGRDLVSDLCNWPVLNRLGVGVSLVWRGQVSNRHRRLELRLVWGREVLFFDWAVDCVL